MNIKDHALQLQLIYQLKFSNMRIQNQQYEITEILQFIKTEVQQAKRPPEEVIYDDVDLRNYLKVSKRTTAYWRKKSMITFFKLGGKIYYRLSDILTFLKQYEVPAVSSTIKIAL